MGSQVQLATFWITVAVTVAGAFAGPIADGQASRMPKKTKITISSTGSAGKAETIRLYHGADSESVNSIDANGVSAEAAMKCSGGGEFWATTNPDDAWLFAGLCPGAMYDGKAPALLRFDVSYRTVSIMAESDPPHLEVIQSSVYRFFQEGFDILNECMTNKKTASSVEEIKLDS